MGLWSTSCELTASQLQYLTFQTARNVPLRDLLEEFPRTKISVACQFRSESNLLESRAARFYSPYAERELCAMFCDEFYRDRRVRDSVRIIQGWYADLRLGIFADWHGGKLLDPSYASVVDEHLCESLQFAAAHHLRG